MNLEHAKSLVLSLLVVLSLMVTWGLWTYQPQYETINEEAYMQEVAIGNKRTVSEIVQPELVIFHEQNEHYGIKSNDVIQAFYEEITKWKIGEVKDVSAIVRERGLPAFMRQDGTTEIIFPTSIHGNIFNHIFDSPNKLKAAKVDRLLLKWPMPDENKFSLYFVSVEDQKVYRTTLNEEVSTALLNIRRDYQAYAKYFIYPLSTSSYLYLPEMAHEYPMLAYSTQMLSPTEFKNALFSDPSDVKQYGPLQAERSYTDGTRALEIFNSDRMMRYVNPPKGETTTESSQQIIDAISFINDHAGWTDYYRLYNSGAQEQNITYRLNVGSLPVFDLENTQEFSTIVQTFRGRQIYEYSRSLLNLRFRLEQSEAQLIPSGNQLIQELEKSIPNYKPEKLDRAVIGYGYFPTGEKASVVEFKPAWYVKYDGKWMRIDFAAADGQGGNADGLE